MPAQFQATYTPIAAAGTQLQIKHMARLLATQLVAAGLGKGDQQQQQHKKQVQSLFVLSRCQMIDKVGQLLGRGLVSKDNRPMKCTTSELLTCRVTNGGPIWSAFYVVSQSKNKAT